MSFEDTIRQIVREEITAALAERDDHPQPVQTHVSSGVVMQTLGITRSVLRRMLAEGCPHLRPGAYPRFNLDEVRRFLEAKNGRP